MVFLDRPHVKQYTDVFDTAIKNIFIFKIYTYFYITSIYNLYIHYVVNTHPVLHTLVTNKWFLFINIFISVITFIMINRNYHIYPINKISNTLFTLSSSNAIVSCMTNTSNNLFMISLEIVTHIILFSIVIYTFMNDLQPFIVKKLLKIVTPVYFVTISIITYLEILSAYQFIFLLCYSIVIFLTHLQNINIIVKRYMPDDFYLGYLNIYFILIDILNIILLGIIVEIFIPKRKYKSNRDMKRY